MRFLNFLCTFITSPNAYRNWQAKCLHSSQHGPNGSNWTGGSPIRSRLRGLGMFAFLGLVKIMHVIRRKWLLSLPVGNSVHGTTALCLIRDRPERAGLRKQVQEYAQRKSTYKSNFFLHLIVISGREEININHRHLIRYIFRKWILESCRSLKNLGHWLDWVRCSIKL